ncbi:hypothetical protein [Pseudomonas sp. PB3P13]
MLAMAVCKATLVLKVYISVAAVKAAIGFALTASHFGKADAARREVTKTLRPSIRLLEKGQVDQDLKQSKALRLLRRIPTRHITCLARSTAKVVQADKSEQDRD